MGKRRVSAGIFFEVNQSFQLQGPAGGPPLISESRKCPVWSGKLPFNSILLPGKDGDGNGEVRPEQDIPGVTGKVLKAAKNLPFPSWSLHLWV